MNEIRLYLDGCLVDVDPKTEIVETKQINSLFELKDRQTSYTNNFTVLLTNETSKVLDRLGDTYNTSDKPYRNLTPQVYRGGTPTITDGKFIIKSVEERKKVKGSVQDGLVSLFDAMGSKTLADLNYANVSHLFTEGDVLSSFTNTWEDGYIYTIADYGIFDRTEVNLMYQPPSIFLKWIFEQIFIDANYTYSYRGTNNPLDSDEFKDKILSLDRGVVFQNTIPQPPVEKLHLTASGTVTALWRNDITLTEVSDPDNFHTITTESTIQVTSNNYYEIRLEGSTSVDSEVVIEMNGNRIMTANPSASFSESLFIHLKVSDIIKVYTTGFPNYTYNFSLKIFKNVGVNQINFNEYLTNLKQKDFFKAILHLYGLMFQREKGTNNYEFISSNDLFTNRLDAQDLSDKLYKLKTETFKFGKYGIRNDLKYSYDDSEDDFANGSFTIDDETLQESATMLTVPFKAPKISGSVFNGDLVYEITLYDVSRNDDGSIKEIKSKKSKPYISNVRRKTGTFNYTTNSYTGIIATSNFQGLNFNVLLANNYNSFIKTINRTKVYSVEMELTALDVYRFDFLKLVYLKQFQRYFYCNKIKSFRENKVTKMELVEVNTSRQTSGEYNDDYNNDYNN